MRKFPLLLAWGHLCLSAAITQTHRISGKIAGSNDQPIDWALTSISYPLINI